MGKVKIKRKSTLIDMTAMSDVTVLLLTFFMLTSTFLQKEPTIVYTPSSISEEKVPVKDLVTILVSGPDRSGKAEDIHATEGKIFISFAGDSILPTDSLRYKILDKAIDIYNKDGGGAARNGKKAHPIKLTDAQRDAFVKTNMMGTSFKDLPAFLSLDAVKRDQIMGDLAAEKGTPEERKIARGIPINSRKDKEDLNDFQVWMEALRLVANDTRKSWIDANKIDTSDPKQKEKLEAMEMLFNSLTTGQSISIKADKDTPFLIINEVFENLRFMNLNKFMLMTSLKTEQ